MSVPADAVNEVVASAQLDASQIPSLDDLEMGLGRVEGDVSFLGARISNLEAQVSTLLVAVDRLSADVALLNEKLS